MGAPGTECAFSIVHPDGTETTNLVIEPGQKQGVNDNFQGGSYCIVVSRPRPQVKNWPAGKCINALDGRPGKVVTNLQVGKTYD